MGNQYGLTLCMVSDFSGLFCRLLFFSNSTFSKNSFSNTIRVSNGLDAVQTQRFVRFVGPDLGPNCLHRLSADDTSTCR